MHKQETLEERVLRARLTPKEKQVYQFIVAEGEQAAFMTSTAMACGAGVGDTSVIRLARTLGFDSFKALQQALQQELLAHKAGGIATHLPYEKLQNSAQTEPQMVPGAVRQQFLRQVEGDAVANSDAKYLEAARMIVGARQKFIAGYRNTAGLANYLAAQLSHILPGVRLANRLDGYEDVAMDMGSDDILLLLSLPRYSQNALQVRRMAVERHCPFVVFTDQVTAEVAQGAARVFVSDVRSASYANSVSGLVLSLEILISLAGKLSGEAGQQRLRELDGYLCETGQF